MKDNRDPSIIGGRIHNGCRHLAPGTRASRVADSVMRDTIPDFREDLIPNTPICGLPPEGRRALVNGRPGTKIDPAGMTLD